MARNMYDEVRSVLTKRSKPETQFEIYKNTKQAKIEEFMRKFGCDEESILMSFYLTNFIITGDITLHTGPVQQITDDERIEKIILNVVEGNKYLGNIPFKQRIFILQLTWQIAWELDKAFQKNKRQNTYPIDVIFTRIIDHLIIPLLKEWLFVFDKNKIDVRTNFIWALAEASAAFQNDFTLDIIEPLKQEITTANFETENLFIIGWIICQDYLRYLQRNDYVEKVLPKPTNPHLADDYSIGGLIVYKLKEKDIYPLNKSAIYTSREAYGDDAHKATLDLLEENLKVIKNFLSLDHPVISTSNLLYNNSRCNVIIEDNEGKKYNRFIFSYNKKDEEKNVGIWTYILIQAEDVNFKQMDDFLSDRLSQIMPVLRLQSETPEFKASSLEILNAWIKTLIVELQDEFDYSGHVEDIQKSQKYTLMAISEATSAIDNTLVYEAQTENKRMFQDSGSGSGPFIDRVKNLFTISDYIYSMNGYFMQIILSGSGVELKSIKIMPSEMFYIDREDPTFSVLVIPIFFGDNIDENKLITGIAFNRPPGDIYYKNKPMESRRNIQRSVRLIGESKSATRDLLTLVKERISNNFPLHLHEDKLESMWSRFFEGLKSQDKSHLTELEFNEKIQALEEEQLVQTQVVRKNVVYYILKDLFLPLRLAIMEEELFLVFSDVGNEKDSGKTKDILKRRVDSAKKKMFILKREDRKIIESIWEMNINNKLTVVIEEIKTSLLEKFKDYSEQELNDILISL